MGLMTWPRDKPRKTDVGIAKNYLNERELEILNRIVNAYLELAELQALDQRPMYMRDWIAKLDDFLRLTNREILDHAGNVSHKQAMEKAHAEYETYRQARLNEESPVEKHFIEVVKSTKAIGKSARRRKP